MFVIVHKDKAMRWGNEFFDDFLQFLPKHFKCKPGEFKVYFMDEKQKEDFAPLSDNDLMAKLKDMKECNEWPYDSAMKFLGNSFK